MAYKKIYNLLNECLWQDINGFIRYEKEKAPKLDNEKEWAFLLLLVPGINLIFMIAQIVYWIILLHTMLKGRNSRRKITRYAYDIEVSTSDYKFIRTKEGLIGLCFWEDWYSNFLLLKPKYTTIDRINDYSYILKQNDLYGLYNANRKAIILPCKYDKITNIRDDIYEVTLNNGKSKYNIEGDRILY